MIGDNFICISLFAMKIEGYTSDMLFAKKKAFEIGGFTLEMEKDSAASGSSDSGPGKGAGKGKFNTFTFSKLIDAASVKLAQACARGTRIPTIMLAVRKASAAGGALVYLQYCCRDNHITKIVWDGGKGDGATETISYTCKALGMQYIAQTSYGEGKMADEGHQFAWNTVSGDESLLIKDLNIRDYDPYMPPHPE